MNITAPLWKREETKGAFSFPVFGGSGGFPVSVFYSVGNEKRLSFPFSFPSRFLFPLYRRETGNEQTGCVG